MGYIKDVKIGNNTHLIEPTLYAVTQNADNIIASIDNFELTEGVTIVLKFTENNNEQATLNINNIGEKPIYYNGMPIETNALKTGKFYSFVYDGAIWNLIGEITSDAVTGVKGEAEQEYRTGQINLTAENINAANKIHRHQTSDLNYTEFFDNGINELLYTPLINSSRCNYWAFLPAKQIIIEKTTDGGNTWSSNGTSDQNKISLFSELRNELTLPLINGNIDPRCGLRITFTGIDYNYSTSTAETNKYSYWNSSKYSIRERYCKIQSIYIWVKSYSNRIKLKIQVATGAEPNNWIIPTKQEEYVLNGWPAANLINLPTPITFGGSSSQKDRYWNWRLTFMTCGQDGSSNLYQNYLTTAQSITDIRGYGNQWYNASNNYMSSDHLYSWDYQQNVTFPKNLTATNLYGNGANITSLKPSALSSAVPINKGGTNSTTAEGARTNLGLGTAAVLADTEVVRNNKHISNATRGVIPSSQVWNGMLYLFDSTTVAQETNRYFGLSMGIDTTGMVSNYYRAYKNEANSLKNCYMSMNYPYNEDKPFMETNGDFYSGLSDDTTGGKITARTTSGEITLFSAGNTNSDGERGLMVPAHGSGNAKNIITVDTNNNITYAAGTILGMTVLSGDSISLNQDIIFPGFINSDSTEIHFTINLGKKIQANIVTINGYVIAYSMNGNVKYLNESNLEEINGTNSHITATATIKNQECGIITIVLTGDNLTFTDNSDTVINGNTAINICTTGTGLVLSFN